MSFGHHDPDIAKVPCLACDEWIEPRDLQRETSPNWLSCCFSHPYHFWCGRPEAGKRVGFDVCAECGDPLDFAETEAILNWRVATLDGRLHRTRASKGARKAQPRPRAFRFIHVWRRGGPRVLANIPIEQLVKGLLPSFTEKRLLDNLQFELVHDVCPREEPFRDWLGRSDAREVFADWLEEQNLPARAELVRLAAQRDKADDADVETRLRSLAEQVPSSFVRAILIRRAHGK